jgi:hypothetical protein
MGLKMGVKSNPLPSIPVKIRTAVEFKGQILANNHIQLSNSCPI